MTALGGEQTGRLSSSKGTARDFSALQKGQLEFEGQFLMSRSDDYRRFATECMKIASTAEDEQRRAIFVQMARTWLALAPLILVRADEVIE